MEGVATLYGAMLTSFFVTSEPLSTTGRSSVVLVSVDGAAEDSGDCTSIVSNGGVAIAEPGGGEAV